MTTRFPLQAVLDLMQVRAEDAARELGKLIAAEQDAKTRLALLEGYRDEYAARFRSAAEAGISPSQWANFQDFSARLDQAVAQQAAIVTASKERTAAGQAHWRQQDRQVQSFDTLAERHRVGLRYEDNRKDQKLTDEVATRRHLAQDRDD